MAYIHTPIPSLKLNDGTSIPMLGYGTGTAWYKTGNDDKVDTALIEAAKTAIKLGYYYLDTAEAYRTENELGIAIKESGVDRSKLYVVSKVIHKPLEVEASLRASLKRLQLDYVDQYLIHMPFWAKSDEELLQSWAQMEAVQALGLTKSIGVSNYSPANLETLLKTAKVKPVINQIEFHPYLQRRKLIEAHKQLGIATSAFSTLAAVTKASPGPVDEYMASLAKKYAVSTNEVSLRWAIDQDIVAITTSSKEQRLSDYLRATTFKLTPAEIEKLAELGLGKNYRGMFTKYWDPKDFD